MVRHTLLTYHDRTAAPPRLTPGGGVYVAVERAAHVTSCTPPARPASPPGSMAGGRFRCMIQRLQETDSVAPVGARSGYVDLAAVEHLMTKILLIEDDAETAEEIRAE